MSWEGMYRDLAGLSFTLGTSGATFSDTSSGRGWALVALCLAFRRSSFLLGSFFSRTTSRACSKISAICLSAFSMPMISANRSNFSLKLRSAENLKLNTVGRAGWSMLGELGDSWCVLVVNSRGGGAGLSAGAASTGTGRAGRLRIDGSNTGLGSMRTRYSSAVFLVIPAQSARSVSTLSSLR